MNRVQSAVASPRHPKQTNENLKEFASLPKTISTTTRYPSPAGCHHSILRSSPGPLCVLFLLDRARGPILHSVGHLSSRVKVRVVGRRSCPCSACVRLHVFLTFYSTYTCRPQDFQLDLSDRVTLSSKGVAGGMNETM